MPQPIALYYWPTPNGHKISIALEEMGLAYEMVPVNIGAGDQFTPAFEAISPNRRMPAIVDPEGPGGAPISVFESGAILQYLGRKSGKFYPADERARVEVEEWLFWQVGGLGPMAGQAGHFTVYAPSITPDARHTAYGANRYVNEVERLYGVMNKRLADRDYLAGDYSIADMASWPWVRSRSNMGTSFAGFPKLESWYRRIGERPAVQAGVAKGEALRNSVATSQTAEGEKARNILFGQRAR